MDPQFMFVSGIGHGASGGDANADNYKEIISLDIARMQLLRHALERGGFATIGVWTPQKQRRRWDGPRRDEKGNVGGGAGTGGRHAEGSETPRARQRRQQEDYGLVSPALSGYEMALSSRLHRLSRGVTALRILWCVSWVGKRLGDTTRLLTPGILKPCGGVVSGAIGKRALCGFEFV